MPADFENGAVKEEAVEREIAGNTAPQLPGTDPAELRAFLRRCVAIVLAAFMQADCVCSISYWFSEFNANVKVMRGE